MIELRVVRTSATDRATEGRWFTDGRYVCATIEDRSRHLSDDMPLGVIQARKIYGLTAIPTGRYRVRFCELGAASRHGNKVLCLVGVKAFTHIHVHAANKAEELLGCIAPGLDATTPVDGWIGRSGAALKAIRADVVPRMDAGEECWIEIVEEFDVDTRTS